MDTFLQDFRYAARTVSRAPVLAVTVIATLGVGIAATTTMFSVVYAALIRSVPFDEPGRLVMLNVVRTTPRDGRQRVRWSFPETERLHQTLSSFHALGTFTVAPVNFTDRGEPEQVDAEIASHGYFDVLRVTATRGRVLSADDERPDAPAVALISTGLWQRRYGGDASMVGRSITIDGTPLAVVGILPEAFAGLSGRADVWIPPAMAPKLTYAGYLTTPQHFINVIGRLRPDRSLTNADAELAAVAPRVVIPEASAGPSATWSAAATSLSSARVDPRASRQGIALLAAVTCVLFLACVNIASILLARGRSRRREIAVRMAIGSGRWRIVRQLLTETLLLAALGGVAGVLLTMWSIDLVKSAGLIGGVRTPGQQVAAFATPSLDVAVLLFAVAVSFVTALACGLLPAIETSRTDLVPALKEDLRGGPSGRHGRLLATFVVGELAAAVTLLMIAGLLVRSFAHLQGLRGGFSTDAVVTFWVTPAATRSAPDEGPRVVERLLDSVQRVPGVIAAGVNRCAPFDVRCARTTVFFPGRPSATETAPIVGRHYVSAGYFQALAIPLRAGRLIRDDDAAGRPAVAVINETAARRFWPGETAIGKRAWFGGGTGFINPANAVEIVGVVGDVKYGLADDPSTADFYTSYRQFTYPDTMMIVKASQPLSVVVPSIRAAVANVDPTLPVYDVRTLDDRVATALARPRLTASVIGGFAFAALLLAAFGVYGVMAHSVALRRREIGIRMALGADRARIVRRVLGEGGRYACYGVLIGLVGAVIGGQIVSSMLFGVTPYDPAILSIVVLIMMLVAFTSVLIPARRASAVDPAVVLRSE